LQRNREDVIASFARKASRPDIGALALPHFCLGLARISGKPKDMASEFVDTVTENIRCFLKDKPNRLERISDQFPVFWGRIGAEGDLGEALEELKERHNKG
jgi:hypothetical protein